MTISCSDQKATDKSEGLTIVTATVKDFKSKKDVKKSFWNIPCKCTNEKSLV